ncbi:hypothetical protein [Anaerorhabdus sp.]|uniref:hypothetical protein n=1 Tax=Anaerorhabdus sp. TaxID=1872524 RepID=UPI002FCBCD4B
MKKILKGNLILLLLISCLVGSQHNLANNYESKPDKKNICVYDENHVAINQPCIEKSSRIYVNFPD